MGDPQCSAFDTYAELPDTVPLNFSEDNIMWVASKVLGAVGSLGAEALKLKNWLLRSICASEELGFEVAGISDWMENSPHTWAAYRTVMACRLVALDERPGLRPLGIGEKLHRTLPKPVLRVVGDQVKVACRNFQLCAGI